MALKREDDFEKRREHLRNLSDDELKERFFTLADRITDPLVELAKNSTTPSIERSVLLRMGFSSIEAKGIVERIIDAGLLGKGAGNVVLKVAEKISENYLDAGRKIAEGLHMDLAVEAFRGGSGNGSQD
ncbi:ornithine aminomutase subunit alpha [Youngiibacter fragilis]|uniref:D-ornithine aminomutase s component n=1 Tax=Youngiibacter fragilis 232.1 TaxID=994573 RepID=V7I2C2_9CLOT|nr:ornithine aminomutase subunit alpha [Youngiibacter fragilis]ETA79431.1 D-ornithine aminomutase s component [Youngiibacter fragilis 232.1]